jgi:hypothetical protein
MQSVACECEDASRVWARALRHAAVTSATTFADEDTAVLPVQHVGLALALSLCRLLIPQITALRIRITLTLSEP